MISSPATVGKPFRSYALRLIQELLALENTISRGRSPFPAPELASRLMLVDRLLNAPLSDLATLGMPMPLPSPATMVRTTLTMLEERRRIRFPEETNPPIEPTTDS